jgi:MFS family permease
VQKSCLSSAVAYTDIPFRLDRIPGAASTFSSSSGLGSRVFLVSSRSLSWVRSGGTQRAETIHLSSANLDAVASSYVVGAVTGALGFDRITDRFGRRLILYMTLIV